MTTPDAEALPVTGDGRRWRHWDEVKAEREARGDIAPEARAHARAELDAEVAAYHLAELRKSQGRTQTDVARDMGISQKRVSSIESAELARAEVDTIARYVEALGGRVRLVADFPGVSVTIR